MSLQCYVISPGCPIGQAHRHTDLKETDQLLSVSELFAFYKIFKTKQSKHMFDALVSIISKQKRDEYKLQYWISKSK